MHPRPTVALLVIALVAQLLMPTSAWQAYAARIEPKTAQAALDGERQPGTPKAPKQRAIRRGQLASTRVAQAARPAAILPPAAVPPANSPQAEPAETPGVRGANAATAFVTKAGTKLRSQTRRLLATPKHVGRSLRQTMVTEERPLIDWSGFGFGLEFGFTLSEFHQVRDASRKGIEIVHVSNYDGSSNLETVLSRWRLKKTNTRRLELQGPALTTDASAPIPLGMRVFGLGITDDMVDPNAQEAISYTFELKATERTLAELFIVGVPILQYLLPTSSLWASEVAQLFARAVPLISGSVAVTSLWRAWRVFANPASTRGQRVMVASHAGADVVRVFLPLIGTIMSASLVTLFGAKALIKARRLLKENLGEAAAANYGANDAAAST